MQKAEYRYYEISQDLPVMALSGKIINGNIYLWMWKKF